MEELTDRPFFPSFLNKQQKVLQACRIDHVEKSFRKLIKKKKIFYFVSALIAKLNFWIFKPSVRLRERIIYFKKFWIVEYVVVFSSSRKYYRVSTHLFILKYVEFFINCIRFLSRFVTLSLKIRCNIYIYHGIFNSLLIYLFSKSHSLYKNCLSFWSLWFGI